MKNYKINDIEEYIEVLEEITSRWRDQDSTWFRGQPVMGSLIPRLFRHSFDENSMTQNFRNKAPAFGKTPEQEEFVSLAISYATFRFANKIIRLDRKRTHWIIFCD